MAYLGSWKIDDALTFPANTHDPSTGGAADADSPPSYRVYEDETSTPLLTGSMALLDGSNTIGLYSEQITLSAANGFEKGKCYTIYIQAAVSSITGTMSHTFQMEAEVDANTVSGGVNVTQFGGSNGTFSSGRPEVNTTHWAGTAVGSASVRSDVVAISGDTTAADNAESFFDGTGYKDIDNVFVTRTSTAQAGASGTITLDASASATDDFYNNQYIWILSGTGAGQARFISDYVGSTKVASVNGNWATNPDNTSVFVIYPFGALPGATAPTAGEVADAVWDEALGDHTGSGSAGQRLGRVPNAAAGGSGGLPTVDSNNAVLVQAGTGTGQLSFTSGVLNVNVAQISGDTTAADNLESYCDGTTPQPVNVTQFGGSNGTFASGIPAVNATQISGDSTAADNLETAFDDTAGPVRWTQITDQGTAQSATSTTLVLRSAAAFADDELNGQTIYITGGSAGVGQSRTITDYVGSTNTATVDTWTTTPTGTIQYKIVPTPPASASAPAAVNVVSVEGQALSSKVGENFNTFFHNGGADTAAVVDDVGTGGGGSGDWTTTEKEQIRHRLGIDGDTDTPSATPNLGTVTANVTQISGDSTAADNLETAFDGGSYNVGGGGTVAASVTGNVGGNVTGSVGSVSGNVGGTVNGLTSTAQGHVRTAVGLATANLDTQLLGIAGDAGDAKTAAEAVEVVTDNLATMMEDSSGYRFTEKALEEAPAGGGGGGDVNVVSWNGDPVANEVFAGIAIPHVSVVGIKATALGDDEGGNFSTFFGNEGNPTEKIVDDVGSGGGGGATAQEVWEYATRELTDKSGFRLSSTGVDDILDEAVEGSVTLRQSIRLANSALGGKAAGLNTTSATYRDLADSKNRISATVDADGNRTAVTRDLT